MIQTATGYALAGVTLSDCRVQLANAQGGGIDPQWPRILVAGFDHDPATEAALTTPADYARITATTESPEVIDTATYHCPAVADVRRDAAKTYVWLYLAHSESRREVNSGTITQLQEQNKLLQAQVKAQGDRAEFVEDCIAEMALQVYNT